MSLSDLKRLIHRATPRVEDHRAPDRQDFVRREHGHLNFRELVDALDALEFSADAFAESMQEQLTLCEPEAQASAEDAAAAEGGAEAAAAPKPPVHTGMHGLYAAVDGFHWLCPGLVEAVAAEVCATEEEALEGEATPEQLEAAAAARARGAEFFKQKDYSSSAKEYTDAIRSSPRTSDVLHTLYSNRSASRLQLPDEGAAVQALGDAKRCVALAPQWPKGRFREGTALRQLGYLREATQAFREGEKLEPDNKDWPKEIEKTEQLRRVKSPALARQLLFNMLPELLGAWVRGARDCPGGVLQVQANGEFAQLGAPKWQLLRDTKAAAKAQLRYAFMDRKDYLANLAANLSQGDLAQGVGVADVDGQALKIAEVAGFLPKEGSDVATIHIDVKGGGFGKMFGVICNVPLGERVRPFIPTMKDPPPPKASVEAALDLQRKSGFPKALPRLMGFQSMPGDLNFPVIDLARDAPKMMS